MENHLTRQQCQETVDAILGQTRRRPDIALILGSGLGPFADAAEHADTIATADLPHWPASTVAGHQGRLVFGQIEDKTVLIMQGRIHYYEGYSMAQVTYPIRVMQLLGIKTLVVTNAAGGLNPAFRTGDLMLITDHINFVGMTGANPLRGPNDDSFGPRFPSMTRAYDPDLQNLARAAAAEHLGKLGGRLQEGVYVYLSGPCFETPAEVRMLRALGADAVGMSTAPEVTAARHQNMRVLGISSITNVAVDTNQSTDEPSHEEVLEAGALIVPRMAAVLRGVLRTL
jgi:purine-nucleoside phosphorylase